jgi:hypothetical protein
MQAHPHMPLAASAAALLALALLCLPAAAPGAGRCGPGGVRGPCSGSTTGPSPNSPAGSAGPPAGASGPAARAARR